MKHNPTKTGDGPYTAIETDTVPVMSTRHLTEAEEDRPACDWPTHCYESAHGFMVHVKLYDDPCPYSDPEWRGMADVAKWARSHGYDWVRFDADADEQPGLPTYAW